MKKKGGEKLFKTLSFFLPVVPLSQSPRELRRRLFFHSPSNAKTRSTIISQKRKKKHLIHHLRAPFFLLLLHLTHLRRRRDEGGDLLHDAGRARRRRVEEGTLDDDDDALSNPTRRLAHTLPSGQQQPRQLPAPVEPQRPQPLGVAAGEVDLGARAAPGGVERLERRGRDKNAREAHAAVDDERSEKA